MTTHLQGTHAATAAQPSHALSLLARVLRRRGVRVMAMEDPCLPWHREVRDREPVVVEPPPRFNFNPGVPDLTAFPQTAWMKALGEGLRALPASALGYGDPRGQLEPRSALADYLARARGVVAGPELLVVCAGFTNQRQAALPGSSGAHRGPSRTRARRAAA